MKYRAQYDADSGWYVTYGPRRPVAARKWLQGPMRQCDAIERVRILTEESRNAKATQEKPTVEKRAEDHPNKERDTSAQEKTLAPFYP